MQKKVASNFQELYEIITWKVRWCKKTRKSSVCVSTFFGRADAVKVDFHVMCHFLFGSLRLPKVQTKCCMKIHFCCHSNKTAFLRLFQRECTALWGPCASLRFFFLFTMQFPDVSLRLEMYSYKATSLFLTLRRVFLLLLSLLSSSYDSKLWSLMRWGLYLFP